MVLRTKNVMASISSWMQDLLMYFVRIIHDLNEPIHGGQILGMHEPIILVGELIIFSHHRVLLIVSKRPQSIRIFLGRIIVQ